MRLGAFILALSLAPLWVHAAALPSPPNTVSVNGRVPAPPPPPITSPLDFFRKLLAMTPAELDAALAGRSEHDRSVLEAKLAEFRALDPEQRETRFQALQRQLDFRLLIRVPASNRLDHISLVRETDRPWLLDRLKEWDGIGADMQKALLTNLAVLAVIFPESGLRPRTINDARNLTPRQKEVLEKAVAQWNQLPEDRRQDIREYFRKFFDLDEKSKAKVLQPLNDYERRQMERCLEIYAKLGQSEQEKCIAGFQKFAELSIEERKVFLKNAEQWQSMAPQERQVFRDLVKQFRRPLPPSPPGFQATPPPPPVPRILPRVEREHRELAGTNQ